MYILGCRLDPIDAGEAVNRIAQLAREGRGSQIITLGTEMVVYAQRHPEYRDVINACALSLCDTIGLLAVARMRGAKIQKRVTGVELVEDLCARAMRDDLPVFLLGGAPGVAQSAALKLCDRYPSLRVVGTHDGYFPESESQDVAVQIRDSKAQLLFVGLGFPRQEFWLQQYLPQTGCGAGIGVGGSFDVISGKMMRAPAVFRFFGLEWLYRLVREPKRWRRQLALPKFVWLALGESLRGR